MMTRRKMMLTTSAVIAAGTALLQRLRFARADSPPPEPASPPSAPPPSVITLNGSSLPFTLEDGCKTFRLTAEQIKKEFAPGMTVNCWGYNGQTPGPTIEVTEGDRLRIYVTNKLPEPTTIHWHGMRLPNGMDGVAGLTQPGIPPGETVVYEFACNQQGTLMYHPHFDEMVQMALGMMGFLIIHPKKPTPDQIVDRDFAIMLMEWAVAPGTSTPNPSVMTDFNLFTFNSRIYPGIDPMILKQGDRVRIRLGNLSMDGHPIHLHGHMFQVTGTDGGPVPPTARWPENTVNVPVGATRDIQFIADNPGDWAFHCHKTHHAMNAMSHDIPNMIGVDQTGLSKKVNALTPHSYMPMGTKGMGEMETMKMPGPKNTVPMMGGDGPFGSVGMGGMFTVVKIRKDLPNYNDPGWYPQPEGTSVRSLTSPRPR
jgi:FtsP/CotA-like multicopper oxidase with cupredoxin domain